MKKVDWIWAHPSFILTYCISFLLLQQNTGQKELTEGLRVESVVHSGSGVGGAECEAAGHTAFSVREMNADTQLDLSFVFRLGSGIVIVLQSVSS